MDCFPIDWYWHVVVGFLICTCYYLVRYEKPKPGKGMPWTFFEYIRFDIIELIRALFAFVVVYFGWSALPAILGRFNIPFVENLPPMNFGIAVLLAFGSKKLWDYTAKKFAGIGK